jgi:threonine/homoserine/homoserine lactone efflux protein
LISNLYRLNFAFLYLYCPALFSQNAQLASTSIGKERCMSAEQLQSLLGYVVAMVATPGPNNLLLMSAGANFGFRRSLPHIFGIVCGCQVLLLAAALGVSRLLTQAPTLMWLLRWTGAAFLVWLAWNLVRTRQLQEAPGAGARPFSFMQAALFQWVNPKAWLMTLTAVASYCNPADFAHSLLIVSLAFGLLGLPLISLWNLGGSSLRQYLQRDNSLQWFNRGMALLLVASLYPIIATT